MSQTYNHVVPNILDETMRPKKNVSSAVKLINKGNKQNTRTMQKKKSADNTSNVSPVSPYFYPILIGSIIIVLIIVLIVLWYNKKPMTMPQYYNPKTNPHIPYTGHFNYNNADNHAPPRRNHQNPPNNNHASPSRNDSHMEIKNTDTSQMIPDTEEMDTVLNDLDDASETHVIDVKEPKKEPSLTVDDRLAKSQMAELESALESG